MGLTSRRTFAWRTLGASTEMSLPIGLKCMISPTIPNRTAYTGVSKPPWKTPLHNIMRSAYMLVVASLVKNCFKKSGPEKYRAGTLPKQCPSGLRVVVQTPLLLGHTFDAFRAKPNCLHSLSDEISQDFRSLWTRSKPPNGDLHFVAKFWPGLGPCRRFIVTQTNAAGMSPQSNSTHPVV